MVSFGFWTIRGVKMIRLSCLLALLAVQCCTSFNLPHNLPRVNPIQNQFQRGSRNTLNARKNNQQCFRRAVSFHATSDDEIPEIIPITSRDDVGGYDPIKEKLGLKRQTAVVGAPQVSYEEDLEDIEISKMNITQVMTELQAIQSQGPRKYCVLGTRHCSFLHQQIVEMLAYALVLSGNHLYTSGAQGTNAAAIRGALRAFQPNLLTVILPQSMSKQTPESQDLLEDVTNIITMPENDKLPLDVASRICNSHLLSQTDHLISFAFHESFTVLEAVEEAHKLDKLVTLLYLD